MNTVTHLVNISAPRWLKVGQSTHPGPSFINQIISPAIHNCLQQSCISKRALWCIVHDLYNWINHESSKHDRNISKLSSYGVFYCWKLLFSVLCCFKALRLLESGNFKWKPSWHVHTTWASIVRGDSFNGGWCIVGGHSLNIVNLPS